MRQRKILPDGKRVYASSNKTALCRLCYWPVKIVFVLICSRAFATNYQDLSQLEKSVVDEGLLLFDLTPVDKAEGRVIRKIHILTSKPFAKTLKIFSSLNNFHIDTKDDIVRRRIFQSEGEIYNEDRVRDSEIALRSHDLVRSLAVIVPVRSRMAQDSDDIELLVASKDLLSFRPSFSFKGSQETLTNLSIAIGENNFLGLNKMLGASYEYQQSGHILAAKYFDPMLFGSRFELSLRPSLILEPNASSVDGFLGDLKFGRPLISNTQLFSYGINTNFGSRSMVDFAGNKIRQIDVITSHGREHFEKKYRWAFANTSIFGRLSLGDYHKNEISLSYELNVKRPSLSHDLKLTTLQKEYFVRHVMPKNELESCVVLGYSYFQNQFMALYDYDNYQLQELRRTGPSLTVASAFSSKKILFSDHDFLRPEIKLSYLKSLGQDSFIHGYISTSNRFDGSFNDNMFKHGFAVVSSKLFGLFRIVGEGHLLNGFSLRDNQKMVLGNESGIRGVGSRYYSGEKGFRINLELRSVPVDIWIFHAGLVSFYDVGAAFDRWHKANATHALGFGIRVLAPQISSVPFRFDLAFPVYGQGSFEHRLVPSFGTGQAF